MDAEKLLQQINVRQEVVGAVRQDKHILEHWSGKCKDPTQW